MSLSTILGRVISGMSVPQYTHKGLRTCVVMGTRRRVLPHLSRRERERLIMHLRIPDTPLQATSTL